MPATRLAGNATHISIFSCTPRLAHFPHDAGFLMSKQNDSQPSNEATSSSIGVAPVSRDRSSTPESCQTKPTTQLTTTRYDFDGPRKIDRLHKPSWMSSAVSWLPYTTSCALESFVSSDYFSTCYATYSSKKNSIMRSAESSSRLCDTSPANPFQSQPCASPIRAASGLDTHADQP